MALRQPTGQSCKRFKTVRDKNGNRVRRCAQFSGLGKGKAKGGSKSKARRGTRGLSQPTGQTCRRFKTVRDKNGNRVRRCAQFSGLGKGKAKGGSKAKARGGSRGTRGLSQPTGQRCKRFKTVRDKRGRRVRRCAEFR